MHHAMKNGIAMVAATGSPESGTWLIRDSNESWGLPVGVMRPVDPFMQPGSSSAVGLEHGGRYFFARNYNHDHGRYVVNVSSVAGADVNHVAMLVGKDGASLGRSIDASADRVIVGGGKGLGRDDTVGVFELPPNIVSEAVLQGDSEQHYAEEDPGRSTFVSGRWTLINGVLQQGESTDGARFITGSATDDLMVQVRVRPTTFNGANRRVGRTTRHVDANNSVHVTLRGSNAVSLRRPINGQIHVVGEQPRTVSPSTWYSPSMEIVGSSLRLYVNDTTQSWPVTWDLPPQRSDSRRMRRSRRSTISWLISLDTNLARCEVSANFRHG
jgi:hypothetical protein